MRFCCTQGICPAEGTLSFETALLNVLVYLVRHIGSGRVVLLRVCKCAEPVKAVFLKEFGQMAELLLRLPESLL